MLTPTGGIVPRRFFTADRDEVSEEFSALTDRQQKNAGRMTAQSLGGGPIGTGAPPSGSVDADHIHISHRKRQTQAANRSTPSRPKKTKRA